MSIKQNGGVFGRKPTFKDITVSSIVLRIGGAWRSPV